VLARVLIAGGDPEAAVALLERWRALATARDAGALVIAVQALMALAHAARGDEPAALGALEEALTLAAPEVGSACSWERGPRWRRCCAP
jgi:LuxR family maltose regulon positive regulatory protein